MADRVGFVVLRAMVINTARRYVREYVTLRLSVSCSTFTFKDRTWKTVLKPVI
jgi:hypothetical protein